jgi:predicted metal-dependent RNase
MKKIHKAIAIIITFTCGMAAGGALVYYFKNKIINSESKRLSKFKCYYNMLNQWLILKQDGKRLEEYFINKGYQKIAIYGMGELGNRLFEELKNSSITVTYGIDKNSSNTYSELEVYDLNEDLKEVDVIIVTAVFDFDKIQTSLSKIMKCPIISLDDVIFEI